ncbi:uncharacterized protein LOC132304681 [Cornus florida]|uniref:uncharacterized protein LOC132304681 n=1 Tax=Cornus florida TaxID=4283 RepID=UPI002898A3BB|nr:uncharacterized protein LOC132304681 [Cornus florida]
MAKPKRTIDCFFQKNDVPSVASASNVDVSVHDNQRPSKSLRVEHIKVDHTFLEHDPGLHHQIWDYLVDEQYSPSKDAAYCLPCFLFGAKPTGHPGTNAFTSEGFQSWKKVNDGNRCAFLNHVGGSPCSAHSIAERACKDLMNQPCHIDTVMVRQTSEQVSNNRLRLKVTIDAVQWLTYQACAFRGHDESFQSSNRDNFIEMVKAFASYNDDVARIVLENAPKNAKYTSPQIQKEILHIVSRKVRSKIREDNGDAKFCILVDEARDEFKREQMALVLRYVDKDGFLQERFFDLVHVKDTTSLNLKKDLCAVLSYYNLDVHNLRGQGYDGASNMRGEWNGLQSLFLNDCPYAYYVHCLAHRLQLALVAASREVIGVYQFFSNLNFIINNIGASCKRTDELHSAQVMEIAHLIYLDELETSRGANQIVLNNLIEDGCNYKIRGDADTAFNTLRSFQFVFILHLIKDITGITNILCQALQQKDEDIVNAMQLVSSTKQIIMILRENDWNKLFDIVKSFCECHNIDVPDLSVPYTKKIKGQSRHPQENITLEHHYRIDIFYGTIDSQLQELNNRFSEKAMKLVTLSSALDPRDGYKFFNVEDICTLVDEFYLQDFTDQERIMLTFQLQHYEVEMPVHSYLKNMSTISELCRGLVETKKSKIYFLIDGLIRLVLTLPISTATTERAFSTMKLVKTQLRNRMEDEFLADYLSVSIEKEIAQTFSTDSIMYHFQL